MDYRTALIHDATDFIRTTPPGTVSADVALSPELTGMRFFDEPLFGFADPDDPIFVRFTEPGIIGPHYKLPRFWLPEAATVISFFLPFTETVRRANARDFDWPANEWLHARIQGQALIADLTAFLLRRVEALGFSAMAPLLDKRFHTGSNPENPAENYPFTSNWSERHCAHACGLGTFAITRGLITPKGTAGRFGSLIVSMPIPPDPRPYTRYNEYCILCGACVPHCPAGAINLETGKDQKLCQAFLGRTGRETPGPYYGCGKCQVGVPCEAGIP